MGPILRVISGALAAGLVLAPGLVLAGRSHGPSPGGRLDGRGGDHGRPFGRNHPANRFLGHGHHGHGHFGNHFGHGNRFGMLGPGLVYAPPLYGSLYYGGLAYGAAGLDDPPVGYDPPVRYDPPVVYSAPPVAYAPQTGGVVSMAPAAPPPAPAPPTPNVIEYPTGRYELRGDGVTTAYTWVWIPNPPPAPPTVAPAPVGPSGTPAAAEPSPVRRSQLYRWTDEEGVLHFTDRWEVVPEEYRSQTTRPPSS